MKMDSKTDKGISDTHFSSVGLHKPPVRRRGLLVKRPDLAKAACLALGFDFDDLTMKTQDELYDPKKPADINNLIYDHYKKRYQRKVAQVEAKVKELLYNGKMDLSPLHDHHENPGERRCSSSGSHDNGSRARLDSYQDSINYAKTARPPINFHVEFESEKGSDDQVEVVENEIAKDVLKNYRKKLNKVQERWDGETKGLTNKPSDDPNKLLNYAMQNQVGKLNRSIEKAEKYAQSIIEDTNKREMLRERLLEREQLTIKLKEKMEKERRKAFKKNQQSFDGKLKQINVLKREFHLELRKNASSLQKRFSDLEIKLQSVEEQRKHLAKSRSIEFSNKVARAKEQKDAEYEELYKSFRDEESRLQNHLECLKSERKVKCDESAKAFEDSYKKAIEKRGYLSCERDSQTIERLCKKSQGAESVRQLIKKDFKKKLVENAERETTFKQNFQEIMKNKEQWRRNVVKSYRESQERIKEYQSEKVHELELKKEMNSLKRQDQIENYFDLKRLQEMRNVQIIEKEKTRSLKQSLLREQNKILSLARIDVDRRMKLKVDDMVSSALRGGNKSVELRRPKQLPNIEEIVV